MIFSRELFSELLEAPLDQGARAVVRRHNVLHLPVDDEGILHDLDDPETYRRVTGLEVPEAR
jgi:CTP:molybdopterin cytidylyltransferase MocA